MTRVLLQSPYDITIMARDEKKAKGIFPEANIVYGDVFDPFSLLPVLEGKDIVYISIGPERNPRKGDRMAEEEGLDNIVETAKTGRRKKTGIFIITGSALQQYQQLSLVDIRHQTTRDRKDQKFRSRLYYFLSFLFYGKFRPVDDEGQ